MLGKLDPPGHGADTAATHRRGQCSSPLLRRGDKGSRIHGFRHIALALGMLKGMVVERNWEFAEEVRCIVRGAEASDGLDSVVVGTSLR